MNLYKSALLLSLVLMMFQACAPASGDHPGTEFMPDMQHSVAYEANVNTDYRLNVWDDESKVKRKDMSMPRHPVAGTIPRGATGMFYAESSAVEKRMANSVEGRMVIPENGFVPFYYDNTEEERLRAQAEILSNPFPIRDADLKRAKGLYDIYCGICHGEKGDGNGYLVRDDGGVYPNAPANFLLDDFVNSSPGRYYFGIMHGKNVMGSYSEKLSYEERWQVIHYIRSLQAKDKGLAYDENANTLNSFAIPGSAIQSSNIDSTQLGEMDTNNHETDQHDQDEGDGSHEDQNNEHH